MQWLRVIMIYFNHDGEATMNISSFLTSITARSVSSKTQQLTSFTEVIRQIVCYLSGITIIPITEKMVTRRRSNQIKHSHEYSCRPTYAYTFMTMSLTTTTKWDARSKVYLAGFWQARKACIWRCSRASMCDVRRFGLLLAGPNFIALLNGRHIFVLTMADKFA